MSSLISTLIRDGDTSRIFHASVAYNDYLTRMTDGIYGDKFVVKIFKAEGSLIQSQHRIERTVKIYEKIHTYIVPHVLPAVHWIAFRSKTDYHDKFRDGETIDARNIRVFAIAFPEMEGTLQALIPHLTKSQRIDAACQLILMVHGLFKAGIHHRVFNPRNVMYKRHGNGYYYALIDLTHSEIRQSPRESDYPYLADYVEDLVGFTNQYIKQIRTGRDVTDKLVRDTIESLQPN